MNATRILWGQVVAVCSIALAFVWAATQWTAAALGYQAQLGAPWFRVDGYPVYHPPAFFWWWFAYDAYAPDVFVHGAYIAAAGGLAAVVVAIAQSVWRAREVKHADTYGSARWATEKEVRKAGLLGEDGTVLGRLGDDYIRHDGPEHVLCFAPTRSGKGVGLVIPTLLTWAGSVIVHDIKGENFGLTAGWRSALLACAAVRSDRRGERRIQPTAGGAPRTLRGARRAERRRHPGRPGRSAGETKPLGEDQPRAPGRSHPARPLRRSRQDAGRRRQLPLRSQTPDRDDAPGDDDDRASW